MFDFIPVLLYNSLYYYFLLFIVLVVFLRSNLVPITDSRSIKTNKTLGILILIFTLVYMGLRPLSWVFGDMGSYAEFFQRYQRGESPDFNGDIVFNSFTKSCSSFMNVEVYFLLCAFLYVFPLWSACKKWFKSYSFYAFLALITSFSFWTFGTNGIRNGIATSFFLYALSKDKLLHKILIILVAIGIHKSIVIPAAALCLTYFYIEPKKYFYGWLSCIPLSLVSGGFWEALFAGFMADERSSYLTSGNINNDSFSSSGFRWDFLLYSASAVYTAYFFIFKKNFTDQRYNRLVCVYLAANAFWVLVIRANFSNRFAYLSWFMMGIVIVYPFLTKIQIKKQHQVLGLVLLAYFGFTFLMNIVLV